MFIHLVNPTIQKMIIGSDPRYFLWIIGNTLWQKQEFFMSSTIGLLGWLDISLPPIIYYGFVFLLGAGVFKISSEKKSLPLFILFSLTSMLIATAVSIMYYFYLHGTAVAYPLIDSLQGRYLLPVLPFIFLVLVEWFTIARRHANAAIGIGGLLFIFLVSQTVFFRYYDYSRVFDNAEFLSPLEKDLQDNKELPVVVIREKQSYVYDVRYPGYKIGGFQVLVTVDSKLPVNVPYLYEVQDATCTKTIRRGYFDQTELHRPHIYTQLFSITVLAQDRLCLALTPLYGTRLMQYLPLVAENGKPVVNFLYIKR